MKFREVCQIDELGYFVGITVAQESPEEPGKLLLPPDCVDIDPPAYKEGWLARLVNGEWINEPYHVQQVKPDPNQEEQFYIELNKKYANITYSIGDFTISLNHDVILSFKLYLELDKDEFVITNSEDQQTSVSREELVKIIKYYAKRVYELDNTIWK